MVARAVAAGVTRMVTICTRLRQAGGARHRRGARRGVCGPPAATRCTSPRSRWRASRNSSSLAAHPKLVGIGETGLDYHYTAETSAAQAESLRVHFEAARRTGLPLIIHARDADDDIGRDPRRGARRRAVRLRDALLYRRPRAGRDGARRSASTSRSPASRPSAAPASAARDLRAHAPLDRLLVETDSPYLAPQPHRGRRNEPAYVADTARAMAAHLGLDPAEFAALTSANFDRLFAKAAGLMARLRATILGCGSSGGVPRIGGDWGACDPADPRNRRRRCSLLVERVDGDGDHAGADRHPARPARAAARRRRRPARRRGLHPPACRPRARHRRPADRRPQPRQPPAGLGRRRDHRGADLPLRLRLRAAAGQPLSADPRPEGHRRRRSRSTAPAGRSPSGRSASSTAASRRSASASTGSPTCPTSPAIPDEAWPALEGLDIWVLDALRRKPHPTHAHLARSLDWIARAAPRRAVLTNMHNDLDYRDAGGRAAARTSSRPTTA